MHDVRGAIVRIAEEQLGLPRAPRGDDSFIDDLGADSLDMVVLVMAAEEEFGIEIPDEVAREVLTVDDAVRYIKRRLNLAA